MNFVQQITQIMAFHRYSFIVHFLQSAFHQNANTDANATSDGIVRTVENRT